MRHFIDKFKPKVQLSWYEIYHIYGINFVFQVEFVNDNRFKILNSNDEIVTEKLFEFTNVHYDVKDGIVQNYQFKKFIIDIEKILKDKIDLVHWDKSVAIVDRQSSDVIYKEIFIKERNNFKISKEWDFPRLKFLEKFSKTT